MLTFLPTALRWTRKNWGRKCTLSRTPDRVIDLAEIVASGYSSKHVHRVNTNEFTVLTGDLDIIVYQDAERTAKVRLRAGQSYSVPPGVWHSFFALTDVRLIEIYHRDVTTDDIERADEGGVAAEPVVTQVQT